MKPWTVNAEGVILRDVTLQQVERASRVLPRRAGKQASVKNVTTQLYTLPPLMNEQCTHASEEKLDS